MKKILIGFLVSAAIAAPLAQAQQAAAAPDAKTTAAVHELLDAIHYRDMMRNMMGQMARQMPQMMQQSAAATINADKSLSAEQRKAKLDKLAAELPKVSASMERLMNDPSLVDDMMKEMVPLYARHFTADEIRQLTAFYHSPVGAKALSVMPQLMMEGMQLGQRVIMPRVQKMAAELEKDQPKAK